MKDNIIIIGFSATGKTVIAKMVAQRLGWKAVDMDDEIVHLTGKSIPQIFAQEGEQHFRKLETEVLKKACRQHNAVIATGGGAVISEENRSLMKKGGFIVCLEAQPETVFKRLKQDLLNSESKKRPLLAVESPLDRIEELKKLRQNLYSIADWTIHTDNLSLDEVVFEVVRGWQIIARKSVITENRNSFLVHSQIGDYPVILGNGIFKNAGKYLKKYGLSGRVFVISDDNVFSLYGDELLKNLETGGYPAIGLSVPPGETTKTLWKAIEIYDFLIENRVERNDIILALGGGMVGDLAGFTASTILRGIKFVQLPTSLLAMVDASIGGKVAINHGGGKNLIGSFYPPQIVLSDINTLQTLPRRELISGYSEAIKHAIIRDVGLFKLFEKHKQELLRIEPAIMTKVVKQSAAIKGEIVSQDERESGIRIFLNFGHTIAHAIEAATSYEGISHGEAVAIGMVGAARLSQSLGILQEFISDRIISLIQGFGLPVFCRGVNIEAVMSAMQLDKKTKGKETQWVLLQDIGKAVVRSGVPPDDVFSVLKSLILP